MEILVLPPSSINSPLQSPRVAHSFVHILYIPSFIHFSFNSLFIPSFIYLSVPVFIYSLKIGNPSVPSILYPTPSPSPSVAHSIVHVHTCILYIPPFFHFSFNSLFIPSFIYLSIPTFMSLHVSIPTIHYR